MPDSKPFNAALAIGAPIVTGIAYAVTVLDSRETNNLIQAVDSLNVGLFIFIMVVSLIVDLYTVVKKRVEYEHSKPVLYSMTAYGMAACGVFYQLFWNRHPSTGVFEARSVMCITLFAVLVYIGNQANVKFLDFRVLLLQPNEKSPAQSPEDKSQKG